MESRPAHDVTLPDAPRLARDLGGYAYGRYRGAIEVPNVSWHGFPSVLAQYRLKQWQYHSIVTERWFIAFACVDLGYVSTLFCYVVDRDGPSHVLEFDATSPLGRALCFAPGPTRGATRWSSAAGNVMISSTGGSKPGWRAKLDLQIGCNRVVASAHIQREPGHSTLFELAAERAAYTYKSAAMPCSLELEIAGSAYRSTGLASIDWTRSAALTQTCWKWAMFAHPADDGRRLGFNASSDVYDLAGASQENALFVDGNVVPLGAVAFTVPRHPAREPWRLNGSGVNLVFTPRGARAEDLTLGPLRSDFVQPFGTFDGEVQTGDGGRIAVRDAFGVVEKHVARW